MAYAAYDDLSIYAVHNTAEGALSKALADSGCPEAKFQVAPITDDFAAWISRNGWDGMHRSFEVADNGFLVDTTSA